VPSEIIRAPGHDRRRSLGWLAIAWIEHFCVHGPGDIQGRPMSARYEGAIPLRDEQAMLTVDCYALNESGRRLYDSAFYSRAKGGDKSGHAARFAMFEGCGPCRFVGFAEGGEVFEQHDFRYEYQPGEPMGETITYPFIRIMATEEGQAGNVYDNILFNFKEGPLREFLVRPDDGGMTRIFLPDGGEIRPSTASGASKDGGKESFVVFDEPHLYITPELHRMYSTVERNLGKRKAAQPWAFLPSTMYEPGRNSVAEQTHKLAKDIEAGRSRNTRLLFDHREAPADTDLDDEVSLRAGLMEAYGDAAEYMDIDGLMGRIWDPRNDRTDSIRYYLNRANASSARAFDVKRWNQSANPNCEIPAREWITLGFDGARTKDSTALIATHIKTGFQWPVGIWERPPHVEEWEIDEAAVDQAVARAFETWTVWRFLGDPSKWETALSRWAGEYNHDPEEAKAIVVKWPVQLHKRTAVALKGYATAVAAGEVSHSGDPMFSAHMANAYRLPQAFTDDDKTPLWLIRKEHEASALKIDAAYAGCLSWEARLMALASGITGDEPMSVYETRGVIVL
jgi:hypothetical protein